MSLSIFINVLIHWSIINILVWISNSGISYKLHIIPFSLYCSSTIKGESSIAIKLLPKKSTLILTIGSRIKHFSWNSNTIFKNSLKFRSILKFNNNLSIEFILNIWSFNNLSTWYILFNLSFYWNHRLFLLSFINVRFRFQLFIYNSSSIIFRKLWTNYVCFIIQLFNQFYFRTSLIYYLTSLLFNLFIKIKLLIFYIFHLISEIFIKNPWFYSISKTFIYTIKKIYDYFYKIYLIKWWSISYHCI